LLIFRILSYKVKIKKIFLVFGFITLALFSSSYVDDYFDISKNLEIFTSVFRQVNAYYVDETKPGELAKQWFSFGFYCP
jgi:carboxyl-terminal processing protease